MIETLKSDKIINMIGGRFKLTALIQRRLVQLMHGERPMVETRGLTAMEVVVKEIIEGKIKARMPAPDQEAEEDA